MLSGYKKLIALAILPFFLNYCSFVSSDLEAEPSDFSDEILIEKDAEDVLETEDLDNLSDDLNEEEISDEEIEYFEKNNDSDNSSNKDSSLQTGDLQLGELNLELRKLKAELNHYNANLREVRAKSQIWGNPFSVYNKELIMNNGSSVYGKIVYQDRDVVKVETLIGKLIIKRSDIVRVVENIVDSSNGEGENSNILDSPDQIEIVEVQSDDDESGINVIERRKQNQTAQLILMGNITEKKDKSGNTILSGEIKNVGSQRADFAKINVTFRKNWHGDTETLTSFVRGSYYTFKTGITSDSSILPSAVSEFEMVVPKSMGAFIGYSYTLDWEQYE